MRTKKKIVLNAEESAMIRRFGKTVRSLREAAGWTAAGFAERVNLSPQYVSNIENGHRKQISFIIIWRIAEAFNITISELIGEVELTLVTR